ncbi:MAG: hypothetical protein VX768_13000 [Planctomycetota bacterium]|nr:hypothetical protein [Planctomycetota bacterium]
MSRNARVAIYLDPEVDPGKKVMFSTELQPLGKTLDEVASQFEGLAVSVGSFVYIAPREKVNRFLVLRNLQSYELTKLSDASQGKLGEITDFGWSFLSNPRDTVSVMVANMGFSILDVETIPHDLWRAQKLPRLARWEQLTFLLSLMNRSFRVIDESGSLQIVEVSPQQVLTTRYRKSEQRKIELLARRNQLESVQTASRNNDFFLRASLREQIVIADQMRPLRKWQTRIKAGSKDVFDLNTSASRIGILKTIAGNRGVALNYAPDLETLLGQRVVVNLKKATIEKVIEATLKGSGLRFRLTDTMLQVLK